MIPHWIFTEHRSDDGVTWTWRRSVLNGTADVESESFKDYGSAVYDAIQCGFRPGTEHYAVVTGSTLTHYNAPSGKDEIRRSPPGAQETRNPGASKGRKRI